MATKNEILNSDRAPADTGKPAPSSVVVIAEHFQGKLSPATGEVLTFGLELEEHIHGRLQAVIVGDGIDDMAADIAGRTGAQVTAISVPGLSDYSGETYGAVLGDFLDRLGPAYVCIPHTSQGWDFAPSLAVRLSASYVTGVQEIVMQEGMPLFTRSVCGGKFTAHMSPKMETTVITVQPGKFKALEGVSESGGQINRMAVRLPPGRTRPLGIEEPEAADSGLAEARVVVAAGKGIGKEENMSLIRKLAGVFSKSAVAGSRTVCDLGWLSVRNQVGLTGATVTPSLYIACGISGASQHVAGMQGADFVVAVNTDPHAAIFNESDICVVEDLTTFIPQLLEAVKQ